LQCHACSTETVAHRSPCSPSLWRVSGADAGTHDSLTIDLPAPLDRALLARMLKVVDG
jgi:hypothetical protein